MVVTPKITWKYFKRDRVTLMVTRVGAIDTRRFSWIWSADLGVGVTIGHR
ncbi:hypothetical protein [Chamaesiphon sp.]